MPYLIFLHDEPQFNGETFEAYELQDTIRDAIENGDLEISDVESLEFQKIEMSPLRAEVEITVHVN